MKFFFFFFSIYSCILYVVFVRIGPCFCDVAVSIHQSINQSLDRQYSFVFFLTFSENIVLMSKANVAGNVLVEFCIVTPRDKHAQTVSMLFRSPHMILIDGYVPFFPSLFRQNHNEYDHMMTINDDNPVHLSLSAQPSAQTHPVLQPPSLRRLSA